ncbi:hypothetical protein N9A04_00555 [Rickettsiales bacterium]|nr:hypothetical protein [Rickettsiales bacterium]
MSNETKDTSDDAISDQKTAENIAAPHNNYAKQAQNIKDNEISNDTINKNRKQEIKNAMKRLINKNIIIH